MSAPTSGFLQDFSLVGKVIAVTGGARGLGLAQTEALLEAGATVHVLDRLPVPDPHFTLLQSQNKNKLHYSQIDITLQPAVNTLFEEIVKQHGGLDGLLNAAGIQQETPADDYTSEDFNRMLNTNVTGSFIVAQAAAKQFQLLKTPGSIVFIASMSGTVANKDLLCCAYNSSKAAVIQLAKNLATEWGKHGIRVNTISPGYIATAMTEELFVKFPERREEWGKQNPLGRISTPSEYRGAAVFLLSGASSFMTGADLRIDGGHACW